MINSRIKDNEETVIINFLKSGLSTRKLDSILGFSNSKGWVSWDVLKKYKLSNEDKGRLFLYSERQSLWIIKKIISSHNKISLNKLVQENPPNNLEKYKDTFVLAKSEKSFYSIFSGETRNIIRDFFNPKKKLINSCQYKGCIGKEGIETVHLRKNRPQIFMESAIKNKIKFGEYFKYDVYRTMELFLKSHLKPKSICFLCKKHHYEYHRIEKDIKKFNEFKKKIIA
jgi:hypothetical protein